MKKVLLVVSFSIALSGCVPAQDASIGVEREAYPRIQVESVDEYRLPIKEKAKEYFSHQSVVVDFDTYVDLGYSYGKDKNYVFYHHEPITLGDGRAQSGYYEIINDVDPITFEALSEMFSKDKNLVYCNSCGVDAIEVAEPETFQAVGGKYARDKNNAYFTNRTIEDADSGSFEYIGEWKNTWVAYAKDKNNVYYHDEKVESADPETFQILPPLKCYKTDREPNLGGIDKNFVYFTNSPSGEVGGSLHKRWKKAWNREC